LPEGGFVVTSMIDPTEIDPEDLDGSARKLLSGRPTGGIKEWHPGSGFTDIPGTESFAAPNGVLVSDDGTQIFVALSTGQQVARITWGQNPPEIDVVPTGITTDNLRWSASGATILVGGHDMD